MSDFKGDNIIDVRAMVERVEEIQDDLDNLDPDCESERDVQEEAREELATLQAALDQMKGYGNSRIHGVTYPDQIICKDYFVEYILMWAVDVGYYDDSKGWPYNCIDWDKAAERMEGDYSTIDFDGEEYMYLG